MEQTTITVTDNTGFEAGDYVGVTTFDMRWWKRLWHFIIFRRPPTKTEHYKITAIESNSIITIR
jgi:hypothetical protein